MAILVQDTFTRSDTAGNTSISNAAGWNTSSDGNTWSNPWSAAAITFSIASNKGKIASVTNNSSITMLLGSGTQGDTEGLVRFSASNTGDYGGGIALRSSSDGKTFYTAFVYGASNALYLARYTAGSFSALNNTSITYSTGSVYWSRFRVTGSTNPLLQARAWQDGNAEPGTWTISYTDSVGSHITGAGQYGIFLHSASSIDTNQYDSLQINDTLAAVTHVLICDGMGGVFS